MTQQAMAKSLTPWTTKAVTRAPEPVIVPARVPAQGAVLLGRLRKIARVVMQGCDYDEQCEAVSDCVMMAQEFLALGIVVPDRFWIEAIKGAEKKFHEERRSRVSFDLPYGLRNTADESDLHDKWLYRIRASTPPVQEANAAAHQLIPRIKKLPLQYRIPILRRLLGDSISKIAKEQGVSKREVIDLLKRGESIVRGWRD